MAMQVHYGRIVVKQLQKMMIDCQYDLMLLIQFPCMKKVGLVSVFSEKKYPTLLYFQI